MIFCVPRRDLAHQSLDGPIKAAVRRRSQPLLGAGLPKAGITPVERKRGGRRRRGKRVARMRVVVRSWWLDCSGLIWGAVLHSAGSCPETRIQGLSSHVVWTELPGQWSSPTS